LTPVRVGPGGTIDLGRRRGALGLRATLVRVLR
jgi:hypothetical protein